MNNTCDEVVADNCTVWTGSRWQWRVLTTGSVILCYIVVLANALNLLVFYFWKNKDPHLLFHVSLAACAVIGGITASVVPISRALDWTIPNPLPYRVTTGFMLVLQFAATLHVAFISGDRWLSVEFAVKYRSHVSRCRIVLSIAFVWTFAALFIIPFLVTWRECIVVACMRQPFFRWKGDTYFAWNWTRGPLFSLLLCVFQVRIVVIAVRSQLRRQSNRRNLASALRLAPPSTASSTRYPQQLFRVRRTRRIVRVIWKSVLPGMAIVIVTMASNIPYFVVQQLTGTDDDPGPAVMFTVFISSFQHICSPLIYFMFIRQYRSSLRKVRNDFYNAFCPWQRRRCSKVHPEVGQSSPD